MNIGNSIGGLTLMVLAFVWLAVFVPQWARRAQEPVVSRSNRNRFEADRATSSLSALELQMIRLTHTRSRMATVALIATFFWIAAFLLSAGTPFSLITWPIGFVVLAAVSISLAASRRLMVLAGNSSNRRLDRLTTSSKAPAVNLKAAPLPKRGWTANPVPQPIQERSVGEMVIRGAKVVPLVDPITPKVPETAPAPEIQSAQIDEILRRRRAN